MTKHLSTLLCACGVAAAFVLLAESMAQAAVKERAYTFDDAGAIAGQLPAVIAGGVRRGTNDIQASTTDYGGVDDPIPNNGIEDRVNNSFVPLIGSGNTARIPVYASAADRPGATAGNLGLLFDGVDDTLYTALPATPLSPYVFDPRDFGGRFEVLSQAWVKPTSTTFTAPQFLWRIGAENGGALITANGKWALRTGDTAGAGEAFEVESNVSVQTGVWTHVAVLRGGNSSSLYINGSVAAIDPGFWGGEGPDLRLGSDLLATGSFFKGLVDNFSMGTASDGVFNPALDIDYFLDKGLTFSGVAGDVNQDGIVNSADYQIWSQHVGFNNGYGQGDPATHLLGDVDRSGVIDLHDFQIINLAALNPPAGAASLAPGVPEPTSLALLCLGLGLIAWRPKRASSTGIGPRRPLVLCVVLAWLSYASSASAAVVVADDFLYDGASKALHVGGGFNGNEQYRGGQNGSAGAWVGRWNQIGDGVITTPAFIPPIDPFNGLPEPVPPFNVALYDGLFGVQSELYRNFTLGNSVSPTQTLYFGGRFKVDLDIGTDGHTAPQFYAPRLFLNRIFGDDRDTDSNGVPLDPQRDRTQDIGLGLQGNMVVARLGAGPEVMAPVPASPPDDGNWHTIVGKLELNVSGGTKERLSVWINPTGVETGGTMAQVEADVLPDLTALVGTMHSQGSVPIDPDNPELGRSYIDDMVIGTAWQDITNVNVPRLTLRINRADNSAKLINNTSATLQLNGYSVESAAGSLNGTGWNSLDEQNVDNWQQNLATSHQIVESDFQGSTTISPNGQLTLGSLFTAAATEDLTGRFTTLDGLVNLLKVEFVTSAGVAGDYNNNGTVDAADYTVWRNNLGASVTLPNDSTPGTVTQADYAVWKSNFGMSPGSGGSGVSSSAVPEPSTLCMLLLAAVVGIGRSDRPANRLETGKL